MYKLAIGVVVAMTIALTMTACSGGSGSSSPTTTSTKPGTTNPAATTTTSAPDGAVASLAAKTATANVKISYTSALGVSATIIQNGLGNSAVISGGTLLISNGDNVVQCNGTTAAATCTDLGPTSPDDALTQVISTYASLSTLNQQSNLGVASVQTIAGRSASCVTFKAADYAAGLGGLGDSNKLTAAATVTVCIDDDSGFALKVALTDRGQTVNEVLATQVGTPSPADFVPPSAPVPLPSTSTTAPAG